MSTRFLQKFDATTDIEVFPGHAGIGVVSDKIRFNSDGTNVREVADLNSAQSLTNKTLGAGTVVAASPTTTENLGTVGAATVTAVESGNGILHKTVLTLTAHPVAVADASAGGGAPIYTFPLGGITILGGTMTVAPKTTSTIASTLKAGVTIEVGVGTATAGAAALTTTEEDIIIGATGPSSTVINVAAAAIVSARTQAPACFDGHTTALPIYLNVGVPTATDIDADATITVTGTITIVWAHADDV